MMNVQQKKGKEEKVPVAVKASREIPKAALVWAWTHVVQPGDCISLLVVVPPQSSVLYLHAVLETQLVVYASRGGTLRIDVMFEPDFLNMQFDVTFPALPCSLLSLDAMDTSGEQRLYVGVTSCRAERSLKGHGLLFYHWRCAL